MSSVKECLNIWEEGYVHSADTTVEGFFHERVVFLLLRRVHYIRVISLQNHTVQFILFDPVTHA